MYKLDQNYYKEKFLSSNEGFVRSNSVKGIRLKHYELVALSLLAKEQLLTSKQFRDILALFSPDTKGKTLTNRVARFNKKEIIGFIEAHPYVKNDYHKFYIKKYGVEILVEYGLLDRSWLEKSKYGKKRIKLLDGYLAAKELIVSSYIASLKFNKEIEVFRPSYYNKLNMSKVMPNGIIAVNENLQLCIEVDTGSLSSSRIRDKIQSYIDLAKKQPQKQFVILFATIDRTIPLRNQYNVVGKRRVNILRKIADNHVELHSTHNLDVRVKPVGDAKSWFSSLVEHGKMPLR
ncbi:hypothetical protein GCM10008934_20980 [Virgibacillus salarius]|uniref:hypothetical protein n=1 Tax=Virgibacillus salarius TaxID=447199 RepID=UPI0031CE6BA6